jgi:isochorismate synthase EntC
MLPIEKGRVVEVAKKDSDNPEDNKEGNNLQNSEKNAIEKNDLVPIDYYVINLMQLIKSKKQPIKENHREVTKILNQLVETD